MKQALLIVLIAFSAAAAPAAEPIVPQGEPPRPYFNRLNTFEEVEALLEGYARAYPEWVDLESIGKSAEGRDMWLVTITNPATGPHDRKPAMYIDGNTHANEVQGTEVTLYLIDFVLKNYGKLERVSELLDRATLYLVPVVNPDGRARWFGQPATANFPRTVVQPVDDDRDGVADEDGFDDLDGDGIITQMRKHVALGEGQFRLHPEDPRILVPIEDDERGDWIMLGPEGVDNDGDGRVNEDAIGYVDPNRTWGWGWEPEYVQIGAGRYPLSIPETRAIALWADGTTNIAAVQSFHNAGKMILRGPGAKAHPRLARDDLRAYDLIGEEGERILPGYRYLLSWKDLYTTYGDTDAHFYRLHGAIAFTNEMYQPPTDLDGDEESTPEEQMEFNDLLTLGRQFVPWKPYQHPQYGEVEIGGFRHDVGRVPESWMIEEETHRNAAFVLFHAHHLPKLVFGRPEVRRAGRDLWRLEIPVMNERAIPSVTAWARQNKIHRLDVATVRGARVLASGLVEDRFLDRVELQEHRPERLMVPGVMGLSSRRLFFLLAGKGEVEVTYDSVKGGTIRTTVRLEEQPRQ
ncbi:MAG: peptidase M14 [Acidobacteria bacterium]|nr:MAG: peptidase M14 [Acidobacteriota bacterium]